MSVESIAIFVFRRPNFTGAGAGVNLENGIRGAVDVGINAHTEEMLMVMGIDARIHLCTPAFRVLARVHGVSVQDPSKFDFKLYSPILVEDPVYSIFVVGGGKDMRNNELAPTSHYD